MLGAKGLTKARVCVCVYTSGVLVVKTEQNRAFGCKQ